MTNATADVAAPEIGDMAGGPNERSMGDTAQAASVFGAAPAKTRGNKQWTASETGLLIEQALAAVRGGTPAAELGEAVRIPGRGAAGCGRKLARLVRQADQPPDHAREQMLLLENLLEAQARRPQPSRAAGGRQAIQYKRLGRDHAEIAAGVQRLADRLDAVLVCLLVERRMEGIELTPIVGPSHAARLVGRARQILADRAEARRATEGGPPGPPPPTATADPDAQGKGGAV